MTDRYFIVRQDGKTILVEDVYEALELADSLAEIEVVEYVAWLDILVKEGRTDERR